MNSSKPAKGYVYRGKIFDSESPLNANQKKEPEKPKPPAFKPTPPGPMPTIENSVAEKIVYWNNFWDGVRDREKKAREEESKKKKREYKRSKSGALVSTGGISKSPWATKGTKVERPNSLLKRL